MYPHNEWQLLQHSTLDTQSLVKRLGFSCQLVLRQWEKRMQRGSEANQARCWQILLHRNWPKAAFTDLLLTQCLKYLEITRCSNWTGGLLEISLCEKGSYPKANIYKYIPASKRAESLHSSCDCSPWLAFFWRFSHLNRKCLISKKKMNTFHSDCSHQMAPICISGTSKSLGPAHL